MKEQIEEMAKILHSYCDGDCSICGTGSCVDDSAAEALYNAGYRKQEWISVEDRLPEECKNVLCFEGKKIVIAFMEKTEDCGEYVPVFWDWIAYDRDDTYDEVCVTHWMPLPEPPKMKGGAK